MKRTNSAKDGQGRPLDQILDSLLLDQRMAILDQLAVQLAELHEQQEWYGALGLETVVLTDGGLVQLLPLEQCMYKRSLAQARAHGMSFEEPCAAPEQYVEDPLRPAGPWTDVYAYAALRWQLTRGLPLMAAPWRQLKDPVEMDEDADGPTQAMLQGLALDWVQRPQSMSSYRRLERLGQVPEPVQENAPAAQPVLPIASERRSTLPLWLAGVVLLGLVGAGAAYWGSETTVAPADAPRPALAESSPEASISGLEPQREQATRIDPKPVEVATAGAGGVVSGEPNREGLAGQSAQPPSVPEVEQSSGTSADQPSESDAFAQSGAMTGQASVQEPEQQPAPKPELKLLSESGALQPVLSVPEGTGTDEAGPVVLIDHAAGTGGVAIAAANESLEPSAQVDHVEQLEPVAAKPAPPPAKGTVALDVRPWGEVYVNGRKQGVSPPLKSLSLAPGSHRIVIKNAGLPDFSTTIRVRSGKTASVSHQFK